MSFAFKKFSFFQQQDIKDHGFPANAACYVAGGPCLFVGCDDGSVQVLDDTFQKVTSFAAYGHKVLHAAWAQVGACMHSQTAIDNGYRLRP